MVAQAKSMRKVLLKKSEVIMCCKMHSEGQKSDGGKRLKFGLNESAD